MSLVQFLAAAAATALLAGTALAEPGLIVDLGGRSDPSFNANALAGTERWIEETGGDYIETVLDSETQREQTMRGVADRGADPLVVLGPANASTLGSVAPDHAATTFVIIGAEVDRPNVKSVRFADHEGSYLAGIVAAMALQTGHLGFIGRSDTAAIRNFACGYAQGAHAVDPDITLLQDMTGNGAGGEAAAAMAQVDRGADVIYGVAGNSGLGALQGAAEADGRAGTLETGLEIRGLAFGGVGLVVDEYNVDLITDQMVVAIDAARRKIIAGEIKVHDHTTDDICPM